MPAFFLKQMEPNRVPRDPKDRIQSEIDALEWANLISFNTIERWKQEIEAEKQDIAERQHKIVQLQRELQKNGK